ncbi:MAG TPA: KamA family radical SAM protein, partial [Alphaproteobacteria bacterium]|nr:KamA family radical SAM protein [Alphaproteobacteria bacterium]
MGNTVERPQDVESKEDKPPSSSPAARTARSRANSNRRQCAACLEEVEEEKPPSALVEDALAPVAAAPEAVEGVDAPGENQTWDAIVKWNDWQWQMRNRIRTVDRLAQHFPEMGVQDLLAPASRFPLAITPYYASLIRRPVPGDPIFAMSVPQMEELADPAFLLDDPLEEDEDMPVPGLVHRYPDRALLIVTTTCAMYCRHCTRKRVAGQRETSISATRLRQVTTYLSQHPEIRDVIISGGDPLTMPTEALERVLAALRAIPSVEIIRIGSRVPVTLPMRVTDELVAMLRKYHPVWINTQFNHPSELTKEAAEACGRLVDAGIPLGNQSVLLKGVNDDPRVMEELLRGLIRMRVRPYYLFQCDLVRGVEHFRTSLLRGIEIMEYLRGRVSGIAIPTFVVDAPGGGGKLPVLPNYVVSVSPTHVVLRNFEGMLVSYPEPSRGGESAESCGNVDVPAEPVASPTVYDLVSGRAGRIQPA